MFRLKWLWWDIKIMEKKTKKGDVKDVLGKEKENGDEDGDDKFELPRADITEESLDCMHECESS